MRLLSSPVVQILHLVLTLALAILLVAGQRDRDFETLNQVELAQQKYKLKRSTAYYGDESYWEKQGENQSLKAAILETGIADRVVIDDDSIALKYDKFSIWISDSYFPDTRHVQVFSSDGRAVEVILKKNSDFEIQTSQRFDGKEEQKIGFVDNDGDGFTETKFTRGSIIGDKNYKIGRIPWQREE